MCSHQTEIRAFFTTCWRLEPEAGLDT